MMNVGFHSIHIILTGTYSTNYKMNNQEYNIKSRAAAVAADDAGLIQKPNTTMNHKVLIINLSWVLVEIHKPHNAYALLCR